MIRVGEKVDVVSIASASKNINAANAQVFHEMSDRNTFFAVIECVSSMLIFSILWICHCFCSSVSQDTLRMSLNRQKYAAIPRRIPGAPSIMKR